MSRLTTESLKSMLKLVPLSSEGGYFAENLGILGDQDFWKIRLDAVSSSR
jgi:hypothetical protein